VVSCDYPKFFPAGGSPLTRERRGLQTRLIHADEELNDSSAISPPIYQTSTYRLSSPEEGARLGAEIAPAKFYTRYGSPNTKQVERVLADLEGAEAALATGSGMAAITVALMSNLQAGDHVVAQRTHYTATITLLSEVLPRYGVEVTQVDQRRPEEFERAIRHNTRVVYTESPTNPTLDVTDLRFAAELAHAHGAIAITDNTFASSYNQQPMALGYDLVVHSATKYLGGHSDVTAGVVAGRRDLVERAWEYLRVYGPVLHPFEAWLLLRGLRTYGLRMREHNRNAMEVARFLEGHSRSGEGLLPGAALTPTARAGSQADAWRVRRHALLRAQGGLRCRLQSYWAHQGVRFGSQPGWCRDADHPSSLDGLRPQLRGGAQSSRHIARPRAPLCGAGGRGGHHRGPGAGAVIARSPSPAPPTAWVAMHG